MQTTRQDRERSHWREWQDRADTVWGWQTPAGQARAARRARLFLDLGAMTGTSTVLEIGCGTGEFTARIAPHVRELWSTDLSPDLLERCRKRCQRQCPNATVRFEIQDAMALTVPDAHFDAAFGCSVLHHLDPTRALACILRTLKPGGRLVFSEPNMLNPQIALQKNIGFIKRRVGDTPDETAFLRGQMVGLLQDAGFIHTEVTPFDFLHPLTPEPWIPAVGRVTGWLEQIPLLRQISGSLLISARRPWTPA